MESSSSDVQTEAVSAGEGETGESRELSLGKHHRISGKGFDFSAIRSAISSKRRRFL